LQEITREDLIKRLVGLDKRTGRTTKVSEEIPRVYLHFLMQKVSDYYINKSKCNESIKTSYFIQLACFYLGKMNDWRQIIRARVNLLQFNGHF
jgi:hypothetical protein